MKTEDFVGRRFGKFTIIEQIGKDKWGHALYLCLCDCGNIKTVRGNNLVTGQIKSCGCSKKEINLKHGHTKNGILSKSYRAWGHMLERCNNPKHPSHKHYGGRDKPITVCDRWNPKMDGSFKNFLEDMGECPPGLSLDRINNNKGYYKKNCRWATRIEQQRNTRNNRLIFFNGKTQLLIDWAKELNIKYDTLYQRIYRYGWSIEKALTTPTGEKHNVL